MIVIDSNVASELMAEEPAARVIAWFDGVESERLWLNAITIFEIKRGLDDLDPGKRKQALLSSFDALVMGEFDRRVLPFDLSAAVHAAQINADRKNRGKPAGFADTQIAGIVVSRGAAIATRNVRHFSDLPVAVINPWDAPG
jgi:toxin FitB